MGTWAVSVIHLVFNSGGCMHAYIYRLRVRLAYAIQTNPWVWLLCLGYSWEPESYDCLFTEE